MERRPASLPRAPPKRCRRSGLALPPHSKGRKAGMPSPGVRGRVMPSFNRKCRGRVRAGRSHRRTHSTVFVRVALSGGQNSNDGGDIFIFQFRNHISAIANGAAHIRRATSALGIAAAHIRRTISARGSGTGCPIVVCGEIIGAPRFPQTQRHGGHRDARSLLPLNVLCASVSNLSRVYPINHLA